MRFSVVDLAQIFYRDSCPPYPQTTFSLATETAAELLLSFSIVWSQIQCKQLSTHWFCSHGSHSGVWEKSRIDPSPWMRWGLKERNRSAALHVDSTSIPQISKELIIQMPTGSIKRKV